MNRHVNAIAGRLSLRPPQRRSPEILDRISEIAPPKKDHDIQVVLDAIRAEFPTVTDFEREFPSLCFALATGVGKTRLMGAFISYLHLAHGLNNFFVLAPSGTCGTADHRHPAHPAGPEGRSEVGVQTVHAETGWDPLSARGRGFVGPVLAHQ
ncbi:MAG: DEAD/DEAH box helicase family protein [Polyangia bacterium]